MNLGFPEMLFLFVLALLIFGPKKLPEIGRQVGKALSEFKRASNDFKAQIQTEIDQMELEEQRRQIMSLSQPPAEAVPAGPMPAQAVSAEPAPQSATHQDV
jgi:sec-independent protein translocase protein TatB